VSPGVHPRNMSCGTMSRTAHDLSVKSTIEFDGIGALQRY
jgi:hypothetical protein